MFKRDEKCKLLETIPGIGKIGATILASVLGNGAMFKNGRHFAAFLGLVPKQHSRGGKDRLRENLIMTLEYDFGKSNKKVVISSGVYPNKYA